MNKLRKVWQTAFAYNWKFGLFLILLLGIPRFILVLQTNISGGYGIIGLLFVAMWFIPIIFLNKNGRKSIGIKKPKSVSKLGISFLYGILFCTILFLISYLLFGKSIENSFVYISNSYSFPSEQLASNRFTLFAIFSLVGMTFSPIGEELLYRGIVHGAFAESFGETKASYFDALAFALTHLAHFGIIYINSTWSFLLFPALLWVVSMFLLSMLFSRCKRISGSIMGSIICHAGYNLVMMYFIFYHIL